MRAPVHVASLQKRQLLLPLLPLRTHQTLLRTGVLQQLAAGNGRIAGKDFFHSDGYSSSSSSCCCHSRGDSFSVGSSRVQLSTQFRGFASASVSLIQKQQRQLLAPLNSQACPDLVGFLTAFDPAYTPRLSTTRVTAALGRIGAARAAIAKRAEARATNACGLYASSLVLEMAANGKPFRRCTSSFRAAAATASVQHSTTRPSVGAAAVSGEASGGAFRSDSGTYNENSVVSNYAHVQSLLLQLLLQPKMPPQNVRLAVSALLRLTGVQQRNQQQPGAFHGCSLPQLPRPAGFLLPAIFFQRMGGRHPGVSLGENKSPWETKGQMRQRVELLRAYALLLPAMLRLINSAAATPTGGQAAVETVETAPTAAADCPYPHLLRLHVADVIAAASATTPRAAGEARFTATAAATAPGVNAAPRTAQTTGKKGGAAAPVEVIAHEGTKQLAAFLCSRACRELLHQFLQLHLFRAAAAEVARAVSEHEQGSSDCTIDGLAVQQGLHTYVFAPVEATAAALRATLYAEMHSSAQWSPTGALDILGFRLSCRLLAALVRALQASSELRMSRQQQQQRPQQELFTVSDRRRIDPFVMLCLREVLELARCKGSTSIRNSHSGLQNTQYPAAAAEAAAPFAVSPPENSERTLSTTAAPCLPETRQLLVLFLRSCAAKFNTAAAAAATAACAPPSTGITRDSGSPSWRDIADAARDASRLQVILHPKAASYAAGAVGADVSVPTAPAAEIASNTAIVSEAQKVLQAAAAYCLPHVADIPPVDLAALLWAAASAAHCIPKQQWKQRLLLNRLFQAATASLLLPLQNAQMLAGSRQLQQAAPVDKCLLIWSLLVWGRPALDGAGVSTATLPVWAVATEKDTETSEAARCIAGGAGVGPIEWLVLAATFRYQSQQQQHPLLLQSSGAMALHALAVRADELTRPALPCIAAAVGSTDLHCQEQRSAVECVRDIDESLTGRCADREVFVALPEAPPATVGAHAAVTQAPISTPAAATAADRAAVSCIRLLASLLHSAALLTRASHPSRSPAMMGVLRSADRGLGTAGPLLISQLLRQVYDVVRKEQTQKQQATLQCRNRLNLQHHQTFVPALSPQCISQVVWVMSASGVAHLLLLQQLLLQRAFLKELTARIMMHQLPPEPLSGTRDALARNTEPARRQLSWEQRQHQHQHIDLFQLACCLRVTAAAALQTAAEALREGHLGAGDTNGKAALALEAKAPGDSGATTLLAESETAAASAAVNAIAAGDVVVPERVWEAARAAFRDVSSSTTESRPQRDVVGLLQRQNICFEAESRTLEGLSVDFRITSLPAPELQQQQEELRLLLEVDGPSHFLVECSEPDNSPRILLGSSLFKETLLRFLGWRLMRLHATDAANAARCAVAAHQVLQKLILETSKPLVGGFKGMCSSTNHGEISRHGFVEEMRKAAPLGSAYSFREGDEKKPRTL
ncbi:hypothetical protein cyc_05112 [Cyclospora cayetanensis]|uniref:RAP domain-containing protein n=1 Tax=Cyclospora cayetanensis TaxID=88456 RepID=A0A1D3D811_9EIME|nr:hypothetical protein cyc_05112 [Cyclospora cayetanensis]